MNSVGGQFRLVMDKADMKRLVNGAGEGVEVRFSIKAKQSKANEDLAMPKGNLSAGGSGADSDTS